MVDQAKHDIPVRRDWISYPDMKECLTHGEHGTTTIRHSEPTRLTVIEAYAEPYYDSPFQPSIFALRYGCDGSLRKH